MTHKIRLGPIAVFLTIIAAVLATLAILTISTSRADVVLAERFATATAVRYELEADGNRFLKELDEMGGDPSLSDQAETLANGNYQYHAQKDAYDLTIEIAADPAAGKWEVVSWKINKQWDESDAMGTLWEGGL